MHVCTGGQSKAQWDDVTGGTPLTFVKDCVTFTTTLSARFWLIDCRNVSQVKNIATQLFIEANYVPFMAKYKHNNLI
jgi:ankyrin